MIVKVGWRGSGWTSGSRGGRIGLACFIWKLWPFKVLLGFAPQNWKVCNASCMATAMATPYRAKHGQKYWPRWFVINRLMLGDAMPSHVYKRYVNNTL